MVSMIIALYTCCFVEFLNDLGTAIVPLVRHSTRLVDFAEVRYSQATSRLSIQESSIVLRQTVLV